MTMTMTMKTTTTKTLRVSGIVPVGPIIKGVRDCISRSNEWWPGALSIGPRIVENVCMY